MRISLQAVQTEGLMIHTCLIYWHVSVVDLLVFEHGSELGARLVRTLTATAGKNS